MHTKKRVAAFAAPALAAAIAAGCQASEASPLDRTTEVATGGDVALQPTDGLQLVVAPDGNEVRYRIREQLVGFDLPNDAVGATNEVSGGLAFDASGKLVPSSSKFVVNIGTLKSDKDRRDNYVRGRILQATEHPTVELAPTAITGLTLPLPSSGSRTFQLAGNLTVKGVTKPTTWDVNATFTGGRVNGTAATTFAFADFGLQQPRVPVVLSVADSIKLEYTFSLVPKR
jgi:polyisoprenoid-binding protein YceI